MPEIAEIKSEFREYGSGFVKLFKDEKSGLARITLSNPEIKNAISGKMMCDFNDISHELAGDSQLRGLILTSDVSGSEKRIFCSGGDLITVRNIHDPEGGFKMATLMHDTFQRIR